MTEIEKIESLIESGIKVSAIKAYRECFGTSLKESKEMIEHYIKNKNWKEAHSSALSLVKELSEEDRQIIRELWAQSYKLKAIKHCREVSQMSLKASKNWVEAECRDIQLELDTDGNDRESSNSWLETAQRLDSPAEESVREILPLSTTESNLTADLPLADQSVLEMVSKSHKGQAVRSVLSATVNIEDGYLFVTDSSVLFYRSIREGWKMSLDVKLSAILDVTKREGFLGDNLSIHHTDGWVQIKNLKKGQGLYLEEILTERLSSSKHIDLKPHFELSGFERPSLKNPLERRNRKSKLPANVEKILISVILAVGIYFILFCF